MSKKPKKKNTLNQDSQIEILKNLLVSPKTSMYALTKNIDGSTFSTVRRNLYKLQDNELVKIGTPEKRKAMRLELTSKGIATLVIEGELKEEELREVNKRIFRKDFPSLSPKESFYLEPLFVDASSKTLLEIRSKFNLKFFDEKWFLNIYYKTLERNISKEIKKRHVEFEKAGIWVSEAVEEKGWLEFVGNLREEFFDKLPKKAKERFDKLHRKYPEIKVSKEE